MRRSGLMPLFAIVVIALGGIGAALVNDWSPKLGLDLAGGFSVTLQPVESDADDDAIDQAIEIIRTRVDAIGVGEPEITRQGDTIVVNLPGVTDSERARELVGQTAELRFRPVLCDVSGAVAALDPSATTSTEPEATEPDGETEGDDGETEGDDGGTEGDGEPDDTTTTEAPEDGGGGGGSGADDGADDDVTGQAGPAPATPLQQDDDTTTTEADQPDEEEEGPGEQEEDPAPAEPPVAGAADPICTGLQTGELTLEDLALTRPAQNTTDQPVTLENADTGERFRFGPAQALLGSGATLDLTGELLSGARAQLDPAGQWTIVIDLRGGQAGEAFNVLAASCFGGDPQICPDGRSGILLDEEVITVLGFQEPQFRGEAVISGSFTEGEAKDLALVLRYGALPVALETQQTQEVSATLGRDSLRAGLISGLVGLAIVALYMIVYYRLLGLVAMGSLAVSGALLWGLISWLGETSGLTLTLAGITGIIVSIGIAVDSNVVFYENLKEDVVRGRSVRSAVGGSFNSAWSTIVKADGASLIGAALLYVLTVGPVRGFAFYLGLSALLDLLASWFFMRPLAIRLARSKRYQENPRALGLRAPEVAPS
jgi:preprotein translocase subunit SecD